jgi:hypothetical protein
MKTVTLVRDEDGDLQGQYGVMTVHGIGMPDVSRDTIELPREHNDPNRSCIAPQTCLVKWTHSPHLSELRSKKLGFPVDVSTYELQNVSGGRAGIRIHSANFAGDSTVVNMEADLEGCIAPGEKRTPMVNKFGVLQNAVQHSAPALADLILAINDGDPNRHDDFMLTIVDDFYQTKAVA